MADTRFPADESEADARMEKVEGRLSTIEHDVAVLKSDVAVLKSDVGNLKSQVTSLADEMLVVKNAVLVIKTELPNFATKADLYKALHEQTWRMVGSCALLVAVTFWIARNVS